MLFGSGAWFIGAGSSEKPNTPPSVTDEVTTDSNVFSSSSFNETDVTSDAPSTYPNTTQEHDSEDLTTSNSSSDSVVDTWFSDIPAGTAGDVDDTVSGDDTSFAEDNDVLVTPDSDDPVSPDTDTVTSQDEPNDPTVPQFDSVTNCGGSGTIIYASEVATETDDSAIDNTRPSTKPADDTTEPDDITSDTETEPEEIPLPPMPGRPAVQGEGDNSTEETTGIAFKDDTDVTDTESSAYVPQEPAWTDSASTKPDFNDHPVTKPDGSGGDRVLYYSIDFDVRDFYFIDENTTVPEVLPVYIINESETVDAETALEEYVRFLYGNEGYLDIGSFDDRFTSPVFMTSDRHILPDTIGRYIAADGENGKLYYTLTLGGAGSGVPYMDMTEEGALEAMCAMQYYDSAVRFLGIDDVIINCETYRYYADGSYEYRFKITEAADNVFDAELNYAVASAEFRMIFYPAEKTHVCKVVINYPKVLRSVGYSPTVPYSEAMKLLLDKYSGSEYYKSYCAAARLTVRYVTEEIAGLKFVSPYYCYYMAYADTDGTGSYYIVEDN